MRGQRNIDEQTRGRGNEGTSVKKTSGHEQEGHETIETRDGEGLRRGSSGIEY